LANQHYSTTFVDMSSAKILRSSIFLALILLQLSCSGESSRIRKFKQINLDKNPIFHYAHIGMLNEAPVSFVEPWNRNALKKMKVHRITLFSKGGKNPDDTLELIRFDYSNKWQDLRYEGFKFDESQEPWTVGTLLIPDKNQTGQILFSRHYGIEKKLKTIVQPTENGYLFLRQKAGNNHFDSTWVFGTLLKPEAIVSKIGKSVFSVELFMRENSSTRDIIRHFNALPVTGINIETAHCSVTFMRSGKPRRSFLLNDQFSQVAKIREWSYTPGNNIASYQEWMGDVPTREMSWHYGKSQLPEYTVIDRNTYFYHYE
jgi:hypothetical protein